MKKIFFPLVVALLIILNGCQDYTGYYNIYLESSDTLHEIQVTYNADNGKTEYTKTVTLPYKETVSVNTLNFKIKATVCRMNNTDSIRGFIATDQGVDINGQNNISIVNALWSNVPPTITTDSMLNYLKQTSNYGYFELQPNESCKSVTRKIKISAN